MIPNQRREAFAILEEVAKLLGFSMDQYNKWLEEQTVESFRKRLSEYVQPSSCSPV